MDQAHPEAAFLIGPELRGEIPPIQILFGSLERRWQCREALLFAIGLTENTPRALDPEIYDDTLFNVVSTLNAGHNLNFSVALLLRYHTL